jgi:hypothetical protein
LVINKLSWIEGEKEKLISERKEEKEKQKEQKKHSEDKKKGKNQIKIVEDT